MVLKKRRTATNDAGGADDISEHVLRLAVMLEAGLNSASAWRHTVGDAPAGSDAERIGRAIGEGASLDEALGKEAPPWRALAACWRVATEAGAPLAVTLRAFAGGLRDAAETASDIDVALSDPVGTARLMAWLPAGGLVLGFALGLDPLRALAHPIGAAAIVLGLTLVGVARWWTKRLVLGARPRDDMPGLGAELCATALSGGVSVERARALVLEACVLLGPAQEASAQPPAQSNGPEVDHRLQRILTLSTTAGVPAAELLRAEAARSRRAARTAGRLAASRLSRQLLLPLGVCTLPAFMLVGVVPLVLAVLTSSNVSTLL